MGSGSTLRNCDPLSMRNGFTPPTHGLGSRIGLLLASSNGDQCPGLEFGTHCDGPNRPSPRRAAIIASAAACPASMPCRSNEPSSTAASEPAYEAARDCSAACRAASEIDGTVETMFLRTSYAAVATAASVDAAFEKRRDSRYGR